MINIRLPFSSEEKSLKKRHLCLRFFLLKKRYRTILPESYHSSILQSSFHPAFRLVKHKRKNSLTVNQEVLRSIISFYATKRTLGIIWLHLLFVKTVFICNMATGRNIVLRLHLQLQLQCDFFLLAEKQQPTFFALVVWSGKSWYEPRFIPNVSQQQSVIQQIVSRSATE